MTLRLIKEQLRAYLIALDPEFSKSTPTSTQKQRYWTFYSSDNSYTRVRHPILIDWHHSTAEELLDFFTWYSSFANHQRSSRHFTFEHNLQEPLRFPWLESHMSSPLSSSRHQHESPSSLVVAIRPSLILMPKYLIRLLHSRHLVYSITLRITGPKNHQIRTAL